MPKIGGNTIPSAHHGTHEDGEADEISIASLSGTPAALTTHEADLDAHTRDILELVVLNNYQMSPLVGRDLIVNQAIAADRIYVFPYPIVRARTPDKLAVQVVVGSAGNLRIGIYYDDGNGYPGVRLTNGGVVDVTAAALKTVDFTTQLVKGLYWIAIISDATPSIRNTAYRHTIIGHATDVSKGMAGYLTGIVGYGNLPDPFTAGAPLYDQCLAVGFRFTSND